MTIPSAFGPIVDLARATQIREYKMRAWVANRPTIGVRVKRSDAWIAARDAFAARWETINEEGEQEGFLNNYGDGLYIDREDFTVESEPNPNYDPNMKHPDAQ